MLTITQRLIHDNMPEWEFSRGLIFMTFTVISVCAHNGMITCSSGHVLRSLVNMAEAPAAAVCGF